MTTSETEAISSSYQFGDCVLDVARRELTLGGETVSVERKVMDLLIFLIDNRNRVVTKDEIQDAVWPGIIVTETALTRAIMKARRAIGDSAETQSLIKTVHGEGYRFAGGVTRLTGGAADDSPKRGVRATVVALVAVSLVALVTVLALLPSKDNAGQRDIIAVLPFDNLSPDPEHAYFASGIQEEVLNEISRGTDLHVIARTSVAQYAGTTKTIPVIAAELGVGSIVSGSVRYTDNRVRITAQLVDGASGIHLWSESYDRDFSDIFDIQSDIARNIAGALEARILGDGGEIRDNVAAYKEFLLARSLRYRTFEVGWEPVLEHTRKALSIDPDYIPALNLLHNAYQNRIIGASHEAANREMQALTMRAVRRDPNHPITLSMRAKDAAYQWRWDEAVALWDRVLEADPSDPDNQGTAAFINIGAGRYQRAAEIVEQAVKINPMHDWPHYADMLLKLARNDRQGYVEVGELIISMGGNRAFPAAATLAMYAAEEGDAGAVRRYGETLIQMTGGALASFVQTLADHAEGQRLTQVQIEALLQASPPPNTYKWMATQLFLMADARDAAFASMDDIVASRAVFSVLRIVSDPAFADLRGDPRYDAFLDDTGLSN